MKVLSILLGRILRTLCLGIFLFLSTNSFCQSSSNTDKPNILVSHAKEKGCRECGKLLFRSMNEEFKEDYYYTRNFLVKIVPVIRSSVTGMIEGMETREISDIKIGLKLINRLNGDKIDWLKTYKVSSDAGERSEELVAKTRSFINDSTLVKEYHVFVENYFNKEFNENCSYYIKAALEKIELNQFKKAITILSYIPKRATCYVERTELLDGIYSKLAKNDCQKKMQKAEILSNSPNIKDAVKAINILLTISPNSDCADKAIDLSEKMRDRQWPNHKEKLIDQKIQIINSRDEAAWKEKMYYYYKNRD